MNIPIVYEDEWILVVDKPAGLLSIPTAKNEKRTLTSVLNGDLKQKGVTYRLHPCHRLDKETSGLMIYAKGKSTQKKMMDQFKSRQVKKNYIAFVRGAMPNGEGEIRFTIAGQSAITRYKLLQWKKNFSVVRVEPLTGRTNQIRIHFKQIGHPLIGESRYAFRRDFALKAKRLCLHAEKLEFKHPASGKTVSLSSPLPDYLRGFLLR